MVDGRALMKMRRRDGETIEIPVENLAPGCDLRLDQVVTKIQLALDEEEERLLLERGLAPPPPVDRASAPSSEEEERLLLKRGAASRPAIDRAPASVVPGVAAHQPPGPHGNPRWPSRLAGSAGAAAVVGVLPTIGVGGTAAFDLGLGSVFDLRASGLLTGTTHTEVASGQADVRLVAGRLDSCAGGDLWRIRLRGCVGVAAGALMIEASRPSPHYSPTMPWLALPIRVDATLKVTRWLGFWLGIDGLGTLVENYLYVTDYTGSTLDGQLLPRFGVIAGAGPVFFFVEKWLRVGHYDHDVTEASPTLNDADRASEHEASAGGEPHGVVEAVLRAWEVAPDELLGMSREIVGRWRGEPAGVAGRTWLEDEAKRVVVDNLYRKHAVDVAKHLVRFGVPRPDAPDETQEVFLRVHAQARGPELRSTWAPLEHVPARCRVLCCAREFSPEEAASDDHQRR